MRRVIGCLLVACAIVAVGVTSRPDGAREKSRQDGEQGAYGVPSPTLGKRAKHFVGGCEIWLFGEFVEPRVFPEYGAEPGYVIEKTDTDVLVNGVQYFWLLWPPEPEGPVSEKAKRLSAIYFETVRQLRERVQLTESGITYDGTPYDFGQSIVFVPEGLDSVVVTFRRDMMMLDIKGGGGLIGVRYVEPPPPTQAELARIDSVRLDKVYSILSRKLKPGRLVLAGKIYINSYSLSKKEVLLRALSRLPERAEVEFVKRNGEPCYKPVTIGEFDFFSPEIADFVKAKGGEGQ